MRDTILFDLDGTLLPVDMDDFVKIYFKEMGKYFQDLIDADKLIDNVLIGTKAMLTNKEKNKTNEQVFMETFEKKLIDGNLNVYKERFDQYYDEGFLKIREIVRKEPLVREIATVLKNKGYSLVVATNPLFPLKAILHRIHWAGLKPMDFIHITSYENSSFCKPNLEYYEEILEVIGKRPEQCIMIGNDVSDDMVSSKLGMETSLITNHIVNSYNLPVNSDHKGTYEDLFLFVKELPDLV